MLVVRTALIAELELTILFHIVTSILSAHSKVCSMIQTLKHILYTVEYVYIESLGSDNKYITMLIFASVNFGKSFMINFVNHITNYLHIDH